MTENSATLWRNRLENLTDKITNPLLIKEMYQSVHNRRIQLVLWLMLSVLLIGTLVIFGSTSRHVGQSIAFMTLFVGGIYCGFLIPSMAFRDLNSEIRTRTHELMSITSVTAWKNVRGRMMASLVKLGLAYSLILPFIAAGFLFGGIGILQIGVVLSLVAVISIVTSAFAIYGAALLSRPGSGGFANFIVLGFFLYVMVSTIGAVPFMFLLGASGAMPPFYVIVLLFINAIPATLLAMSGAANCLSFEAGRSSVLSKIVLFITVIFNGIYCALLLPGTEFIAAFMIGPVGFCSMYWLTSPARVTMKFGRKIEQFSRFKKILLFPFLDGRGSTSVYLFLTAIIICLMSNGDKANRGYVILAITGVVTYILYANAIARYLTKFVPPRFMFSHIEFIIANALIFILSIALSIFTAIFIFNSSSSRTNADYEWLLKPPFLLTAILLAILIYLHYYKIARQQLVDILNYKDISVLTESSE